MEYNLKIGGIGLHVISDFEILTEPSFASFFIQAPPADCVTVAYLRGMEPAGVPDGAPWGEDLLLEYYGQADGRLLCVAKGGPKGPVAVTRGDPGLSSLTCRLNTAAYDLPLTMGNLLRMIPMRRILQWHGVLFLHAAQVAADGKGILFTAPSGTGKTTQAKLWQAVLGTRVICNDRTLIRDGMTYGYPMDGSEPVCSGESYPLGAVVCLRQGTENRVRRLKPSEAMAGLLPQLVFDCWDPQSRNLAASQLTELISGWPVYQLQCTPDAAAVQCLEACLRKDGVIG